MPTTDQGVIDLLWKYGHFRNPAYKNGPSAGVQEADLHTLTLADTAVQEALKSYQHLQKPMLDDLSVKAHGRRAVADGEYGPATKALLDLPRCGMPDYGAAAMEAIGNGSWGTCVLDKYPNNNAIVVSFNLAGLPAFLKPVFDQTWANVVDAYAEIGLALIRDDASTKTNIKASFVNPTTVTPTNLRGGWIGLGIVGWNGIQCSETIWCMFDYRYQPANVVREWTTLIKHELGHNMGLQHSSGGVMNPSIINGLPTSWKGDVSYNYLAKWFGGERVVTTPTTPPSPPGGGGGGPTGTGYNPDVLVTIKGVPHRCWPIAQV